jgi:methylglutaconyl-CoA hydratase
MSDILIQQRREEVMILTLNRPEVHNALNPDLIAALTETLQNLDRDESVHVIVLAGSGKHFCAGGDLEWMQKSVEFSKTENIQDAQLLSDLFHTLYCLSKPTLALVQGAAYGGGIGLIACCDIAIASKKAKFSFSEVKLGLVPAVISPYVIKAIGERQAKRYFLTAEIFDAYTAQQRGLIHELTSGENLYENAQDIITLLLKNSAHAMKISKQLFQPVPPAAHQRMIETLAEIRTSKEAQKRIGDFLKGFFSQGEKS